MLDFLQDEGYRLVVGNGWLNPNQENSAANLASLMARKALYPDFMLVCRRGILVTHQLYPLLKRNQYTGPIVAIDPVINWQRLTFMSKCQLPIRRRIGGMLSGRTVAGKFTANILDRRNNLFFVPDLSHCDRFNRLFGVDFEGIRGQLTQAQIREFSGLDDIGPSEAILMGQIITQFLETSMRGE